MSIETIINSFHAHDTVDEVDAEEIEEAEEEIGLGVENKELEQ